MKICPNRIFYCIGIVGIFLYIIGIIYEHFNSMGYSNPAQPFAKTIHMFIALIYLLLYVYVLFGGKYGLIINTMLLIYATLFLYSYIGIYFLHYIVFQDMRNMQIFQTPNSLFGSAGMALVAINSILFYVRYFKEKRK